MARTLKGLRADAGGMTQAEVAAALGLGKAAYNAIEQALDSDTLDRMAELFGVKIELHITDGRADA